MDLDDSGGASRRVEDGSVESHVGFAVVNSLGLFQFSLTEGLDWAQQGGTASPCSVRGRRRRRRAGGGQHGRRRRRRWRWRSSLGSWMTETHMKTRSEREQRHDAADFTPGVGCTKILIHPRADEAAASHFHPTHGSRSTGWQQFSTFSREVIYRLLVRGGLAVSVKIHPGVMTQHSEPGYLCETNTHRSDPGSTQATISSGLGTWQMLLVRIKGCWCTILHHPQASGVRWDKASVNWQWAEAKPATSPSVCIQTMQAVDKR